jgi:hypothetical protein
MLRYDLQIYSYEGAILMIAQSLGEYEDSPLQFLSFGIKLLPEASEPAFGNRLSCLCHK